MNALPVSKQGLERETRGCSVKLLFSYLLLQIKCLLLVVDFVIRNVPHKMPLLKLQNNYIQLN